MIDLALLTEYSLKQCFGRVEHLVRNTTETKIGVADYNSVHAHFSLQREASELNKERGTPPEKALKPIFGIRLMAVENPYDRSGTRGQWGPTYLLIAKNNDGLVTIRKMVCTAYRNFYYRPMVSFKDIWNLSDDVFVLSSNFDSPERLDYIALSPGTPERLLDHDLPKVYVNHNRYHRPEHRAIYEILASTQAERHTYWQHVLNEDEFNYLFDHPEAASNTYKIAEQCNFIIERAPTYQSELGKNILTECQKGSKKRGIDLSKKKYRKRLEKELAILQEKNFTGYMLLVADICEHAKRHCLVGPGRGSSGGSLVAYLLGITNVDPLKYDLLMERFVDPNRMDLPDIDVDIPDVDRKKVIKYVFDKYGHDRTAHISAWNKFETRAVIQDCCKALRVPTHEADTLRNTVKYTFQGSRHDRTDIETTLELPYGQEMLKKYPGIALIPNLKWHVRNIAINAAGIVLANEPLTNYVGIDERERCAQINWLACEDLNLLKLDLLGLRTLSVLQDCCKAVNMTFDDLYALSMDDKRVYKMFNGRTVGIFQFEGYATNKICQSTKVENFEDLIAISALSRPGPMDSGGTKMWIDRKNGHAPIEYIMDNEIVKRITKATLGTIIYQEQMMMICREVAGMSWEDVTRVRKVVGKHLGLDAMNVYRDKFVNGGVANGWKKQDMIAAWEYILTFCGYGFNKSHAVVYSMISYWCAWFKTYHLMEFALASLNHTKDEGHTIQLLKDLRVHDGIKHIPVDPDKSGLYWTKKKSKKVLVGGLTNIRGVGITKARTILRKREAGTAYTPSEAKMLLYPSTPYDDLFPCHRLFQHLYEKNQLWDIKDIRTEGTYKFICRFTSVDERADKNPEVKHPNVYVTMEDDSGTVRGRLSHRLYLRWGHGIIEDEKVNEKFFLITGSIPQSDSAFIFIFINNIVQLQVST